MGKYLEGKIRGSSRRKRFRREQWQSTPPASPAATSRAGRRWSRMQRSASS